MRLVSKLDLVAIATAMVCGTMWLERVQRVSVDAPTPAKVAFHVAVAACPDNDSAPYTSTCLAFLGTNNAPGRSEHVSLANSPKQAGPLASGSACPDNDNRPYPPACVRFLSGWFWRPN